MAKYIGVKITIGGELQWNYEMQILYTSYHTRHIWYFTDQIKLDHHVNYVIELIMVSFLFLPDSFDQFYTKNTIFHEISPRFA